MTGMKKVKNPFHKLKFSFPRKRQESAATKPFMLKSFALKHFTKLDPGRLYRILTLILVIATLLWTSWNLIYKLGTTPQTVKSQSSPRNESSSSVVVEPPAPVPSLDDFLSIANKNPFGIVPAVSEQPKTEAPPPPPPPPELLGTIVFGNQQGFAILKEQGQDKAKIYKIGDSVNGGRLVQVTRKTAVIKKGKNLETIYARTSQLQSLAPQNGGGEPQQKLIERNKIMKGLNKFIDSNQIRPHFTDGKMDGFTIGKISPDSPLKAIGFESGDILQSVNDKKIESPDDVNLLQSFEGQIPEGTTFVIKRKGQEVILNPQ
jgi:general secretion pathway protein C